MNEADKILVPVAAPVPRGAPSRKRKAGAKQAVRDQLKKRNKQNKKKQKKQKAQDTGTYTCARMHAYTHTYLEACVRTHKRINTHNARYKGQGGSVSADMVTGSPNQAETANQEGIGYIKVDADGGAQLAQREIKGVKQPARSTAAAAVPVLTPHNTASFKVEVSQYDFNRDLKKWDFVQQAPASGAGQSNRAQKGYYIGGIPWKDLLVPGFYFDGGKSIRESSWMTHGADFEDFEHSKLMFWCTLSYEKGKWYIKSRYDEEETQVEPWVVWTFTTKKEGDADGDTE